MCQLFQVLVISTWLIILVLIALSLGCGDLFRTLAVEDLTPCWGVIIFAVFVPFVFLTVLRVILLLKSLHLHWLPSLHFLPVLGCFVLSLSGFLLHKHRECVVRQLYCLGLSEAAGWSLLLWLSSLCSSHPHCFLGDTVTYDRWFAVSLTRSHKNDLLGKNSNESA